jgi:two-component system, NarL family, nitrate/nitrite response regulator NarL
MTRILIVEDHTLFADAIRSALEDLDLQVLEPCSDGAAALESVRRNRPDLVLLDVGLPGQSGLAVGREILQTAPGTKVVVVTALEDVRSMREAMSAGFHGYLTKDVALRQFVRSIRTVLDGQVVLPHRLARRVTGFGSAEDQAAALLAQQLTSREREVLALLVAGANSGEMARRMMVSPHTVRTHVQAILSKLQVHSRLEAAAFALRFGIVPAPAGSGSGSGDAA